MNEIEQFISENIGNENFQDWIDLGSVDLNRNVYLICKKGTIDMISSILSDAELHYSSAIVGATSGNRFDVIEFLYNNIEDWSISSIVCEYSLQVSSRINNIELVNNLLPYKNNIWKEGVSNACKYNNVEIFSILLKKGLEESKSKNKYGLRKSHTLMWYSIVRDNIWADSHNFRYDFETACELNYIEIIRLFLEYKIPHNLYEYYINIENYSLDIAKLLIVYNYRLWNSNIDVILENCSNQYIIAVLEALEIVKNEQSLKNTRNEEEIEDLKELVSMDISYLLKSKNNSNVSKKIENIYKDRMIEINDLIKKEKLNVFLEELMKKTWVPKRLIQTGEIDDMDE